MEVTALGIVMEARLVQELNSSSPMDVKPVKNCSSSKEVIPSSNINTPSKLATAAASVMFSSPSPSVSQLATQMAFTLASAKVMFSVCAFVIPAAHSSKTNRTVRNILWGYKDLFIILCIFGSLLIKNCDKYINNNLVFDLWKKKNETAS